MATVRKELLIKASPDFVWDVIRDVGAVHRRARSIPLAVVNGKLARHVTAACCSPEREAIPFRAP